MTLWLHGEKWEVHDYVDIRSVAGLTILGVLPRL